MNDVNCSGISASVSRACNNIHLVCVLCVYFAFYMCWCMLLCTIMYNIIHDVTLGVVIMYMYMYIHNDIICTEHVEYERTKA